MIMSTVLGLIKKKPGAAKMLLKDKKTWSNLIPGVAGYRSAQRAKADPSKAGLAVAAAFGLLPAVTEAIEGRDPLGPYRDLANS